MTRSTRLPLHTAWLTFALLVNIQLRAQNIDSLAHVAANTAMNDTVRADAMINMVRASIMTGQPDSARAIAYRLNRFCTANKVSRRIGPSCSLLGGLYAQAASYDSARVWYRKAMTANTASGNTVQRGEAELSLGLTYHLQGLQPQALQHDLNALATIETTSDSAALAHCHNNIAALYTDMQRFDDALVHLNKALSIMRPRNDPRLRNTLTQLGILHKQRGEYSAAMAPLHEAIERCEALGDNETLSRALQCLAEIQYQQGDFTTAMGTYERSSTAGSPYTRVQNLINIANCLTALGRSREAIAPLQEAVKLAKAYDDLADGSLAYKELFLIHEKQGDKALALEAFKQHVALRDSITNTDNTRELTRIEMQYGFDKTQLADSLQYASEKALQAKEIQKQKLVRNGFMGGFTLVALFAGVFFFQRNRISKEKARSEELLLNILPEEVAEELKAKGEANAQLIDHATILFTDFKGFTAMSEQLSPKELVRDLHECFSAFDAIMGKYGIEKIKTIGDAYMAAGGLPTPNSTHATDVVKAALDIRDFIAEGKARKIALGLPYFEVRIGVHTGPVVAGIVGVKKFQYDIWGDTVNTASRMESSGEVGEVNISGATYALVKDAMEANGEWSLVSGGEANNTVGDPSAVHRSLVTRHAFIFTARGKVQAKGKGELEMFFVERNSEGA